MLKRGQTIYAERPEGTKFGEHHLRAEGWEVRPAGKFENMLTAWNNSGFRCAVHIPGLVEDRWQFDLIEDPYLLFNAVNLFIEKTGTKPTYPQRIAREILEKTATVPELLTDDPENYWSVFIEKMETEFIWQRKPTGAEKKMDFVHAFDKRMMFLSAARGAMFGRGHWEIVEHLRYKDLAGAVGLVKLKKPKFQNAMFPEFAKYLSGLFGKETLFYTPYLDFFDSGDWLQSIEIEKGFIWRKPERIFEKFAVTIGTAIKETRSEEPDLAAVNSALKNVYTRFFGWLGRLENRTGFGAELFRPDWRGLIVASAGVNLLRNVFEVYKWTKKLPFAINHDCIMYFSDEQRPELEFNNTAVMDRNRFTHEWTAPAGAVLEAIDAGLNPGQIEKAVQND